MLFAILKNVLIFLYNKYRESKQCKIETNLKRYYKDKDKLSIQRKKNFEKNRDVLLAKSKVNQENIKSHSQ